MKKKNENPRELLGKFAIVKLWPNIKTAEDECIARIKIAASILNLECIEIHSDGRLIIDETKSIENDVDFVIHLHYDTPKQYDAFSYVALWNPIQFYHDWDYNRTSRNLTTHDDFLSCNSKAADDHVKRMLKSHRASHAEDFLTLHHSTANTKPPSFNKNSRLAYTGINWEAITGGKSRHQEVLKKLDDTGILQIYGPSIFQGVKVWSGYKSYVKEIPFDGISMIDELSKCGICLVLSSQAHKDSKLMSNRLFEGIAAGTLIICDENPWAKENFHDSLLYIDTRQPAPIIVDQIKDHVNWAQNHVPEAIKMIEEAQDIFNRKYNLTYSLSNIYKNFPERKEKFKKQQNPEGTEVKNIKIYFLTPHHDITTIALHEQSLIHQDYKNITSTLVIQEGTAATKEIQKLKNENIFSSIKEIKFKNLGNKRNIDELKPLGEILQSLLESTPHTDAIIFVAPNERLFSNHVSVLAGALQRDPTLHCAATAAILKNGSQEIKNISEVIDFGHHDRENPPGLGRFIFRKKTIPSDTHIALPYMFSRPQAILINGQRIGQMLQATIVINLEKEPPTPRGNIIHENEIIRSYCHESMKIVTGCLPRNNVNHHVPTSISRTAEKSAQISASNRIRPITLILLALKNPKWIFWQLNLIRSEGLIRRFKILKSVIKI